jgi:hypothetical protein
MESSRLGRDLSQEKIKRKGKKEGRAGQERKAKPEMGSNLRYWHRVTQVDQWKKVDIDRSYELLAFDHSCHCR